MPFARRFVLRLVALVVLLVWGGFCLAEPVEVGGECDALTAVSLRCEMQTAPLGIDTLRPRLTWKLESDERGQLQTAYRVLVAESVEGLLDGEGILWDSGRVVSDRELQIEYGGEALRSRQRCYWMVRVWDREGHASAWSEPAVWEMGLLNAGDWVGRWIDDGVATPETDEGHYENDPAPLMRRGFEVEGEVERARLYISGLGYYDATLNGSAVGDVVLDPLWTEYGTRVFYSTYDVTELLVEGRNALGVMLGDGWYDPLPLRMWGHLNLRDHLVVGRPRLMAQLEIEYGDGRRETIGTDERWKTAPGPLLRNNIYLGEVYDARLELPGWDEGGFSDHDWKGVSLAVGELGALESQAVEPIRVTKRIGAVGITEPEPGVYIFDMGQNFAGWARLRVEGETGTRVRMRFGELLGDDGRLNPLTSVCGQIKGPGVGGAGAPDVAVQEDVYVLRGGGGREVYTPRFTFHAFRYVELTGYPGVPGLEAVEGLRLTCDVAEVGRFACSNELLNQIDEMVRWTFLSNLFGVQSDCPHRERFGYGGDIAATADALMLNLGMANFYGKVVGDLTDSVSVNGAFPMTAPYVGIAYAGLEDGDGPIGWSIAQPMLVWELYRYYGDRRLIEEQYAAARRWVEYVRAHSVDGIVEKGLSDHETLEAKAVRVTSTGFYLQGAEYVAGMAGVLGREEERLEYEDLVLEIRADFARELVDVESGVVGIGSQAAQAAGLFHDLVPESARGVVLERLVAPLEADAGHLKTGIFGTRYLLDVLSREGRTDLAYGLVNRRSFPGWGYMLDEGATTLWEHWAYSDNTFSHNHPMFGSVSTWMYEWLAGIGVADDAVGFDRVMIRPQLVEGLDWVDGSYESVRGLVTSSWRVEEGRFVLTVVLPPGVTGEVIMPGGCDLDSVVESEVAEGEVLDVEEVGAGRYRIGSGRYVFGAAMLEWER